MRRGIPKSAYEQEAFAKNLAELQKSNENLDFKLREPHWPNQKKATNDLVRAFADRNLVVSLVVAKTQVGKTLLMRRAIEALVEEYRIPCDNVVLTTGIDNIEWEYQIKQRLPHLLHKNVYRRSHLRKNGFNGVVRDMNNGLIVIDECHYAAKFGQTLGKVFREFGLDDLNLLYENDIKILIVSATPNGTIIDLKTWPRCSVATVTLEPGDGYVGVDDLLTRGQVRQFEDLFDENTGEAARQGFFDVVANYERPMYHVVRVHGQEQGKFFRDSLPPGCAWECVSYDSFSKFVKINEILAKAPTVHTFIVVLEMLRCSITLEKEHIGVLYERWVKNPDDSVINQGLLGRASGYNTTRDIIVYSNRDSVQRLLDFVEDCASPFRSNTTTRGGSVGTYTKNSAAAPDLDWKGIDIHICDTFDEAKKHVQDMTRTKWNRQTGPRKRGPPGPDGFYMGDCEKTKVLSVNDGRDAARRGLRKNEDSFRVVPVYTDTTDKTTLKWLCAIKTVSRIDDPV